MESKTIVFIAAIKYLTKEDANTREIHLRMAGVFGVSSPKCSTMEKRSAEFTRGRDSLEAKSHC